MTPEAYAEMMSALWEKATALKPAVPPITREERHALEAFRHRLLCWDNRDDYWGHPKPVWRGRPELSALAHGTEPLPAPCEVAA